MAKWILFGGLALLLVCALPAWAGKNNGGAMIVHTNATLQYTGTGLYCTTDYQEPASCAAANTVNSVPSDKAGVIWFLAAFHETASPGVTACYFGNNHNLPPGQGYFQAYGFCGPAGSLEVPDTGWPEQPATAGNRVGFGSPIVGDHLFPFYWFGAYGFEGAYLGSGVNPTGGYAAFVSDDNPGFLDHIDKFGTVRWYAQGENTCPVPPYPMAACCFLDGRCEILTAEECAEAGGDYQGNDTVCDPNPCLQPPETQACCFEDGYCLVLPPLVCQTAGGIPQGPWTECDPNPCPLPPEACCFGDGHCLYLVPSICESVGGTPGGPGTDCDPNPCVPVATETTTWGAIKAGYR